jgi:hypothetical protein
MERSRFSVTVQSFCAARSQGQHDRALSEVATGELLPLGLVTHPTIPMISIVTAISTVGRAPA